MGNDEAQVKERLQHAAAEYISTSQPSFEVVSGTISKNAASSQNASTTKPILSTAEIHEGSLSGKGEASDVESKDAMNICKYISVCWCSACCCFEQ